MLEEKAKNRSQMQMLFWGGLLPVIAFTVIEEWQGPVWGTVAGLAFGAGEVIFEWRRDKKVSTLTWASNLFIFVLGIISLVTQEGVWFKLQPAFLVLAMALWFIVTSFRGTPLLVGLSIKQNPNLPPHLLEFLAKLNFRLGIFFLGITALSVYAAFEWSTAAWATLKGVGAPILMGIYLVIEVLILRWRMAKGGAPPPPAASLD